MFISMVGNCVRSPFSAMSTGERFTSALSTCVRSCPANQSLSATSTRAHVAGYRGGTAQFGDEDLVAILGEEADGVGDAAVLQRGLADHGRALAAGVEALDLVVLHPVGELVDGETDHEYGDDRAQHKEDRAHKAAVPEALRRVGFYVFRKRLAARGTNDVEGPSGACSRGTSNGETSKVSLFRLHYTIFSRKLHPPAGEFHIFTHVLSTIAHLCYNTVWIRRCTMDVFVEQIVSRKRRGCTMRCFMHAGRCSSAAASSGFPG